MCEYYDDDYDHHLHGSYLVLLVRLCPMSESVSLHVCVVYVVYGAAADL